jgi:hypothetical protein
VRGLRFSESINHAFRKPTTALLNDCEGYFLC